MSAETPWLTRYLRAVEEKFGYVRPMDAAQLESRGGIRIGRVFVEPQLSRVEINPEQSPADWPEAEDLIHALRKNPILAVLGDPGSGKSTIVSWIAHLLAEPTPNLYKTYLGDLIPIPMVLRDMSLGRDTDWNNLLDAFLATEIGQSFGSNREELHRIIESGQAFVLVDGFDEVSHVEVRRAVARALRQGQFYGPNCRWMVTSRIVGYEDAPFLTFSTREIVQPKTDFGFSRTKTGMVYVSCVEGELASCPAERFVIAAFDDSRTEAFVVRWHLLRETQEGRAQSDAKEFLFALRQRPELVRLGRNPQILSMMCLVHMVYVELPEARAELYRRITEAYLFIFPRRRGAVPFEHATRWLGRVGYEMQKARVEEGSSLTISEDTLQAALRDEMNRMSLADRSSDFIHFIRQHSGLLMPRGAREYGFWHLSFQEYFASTYLNDDKYWNPTKSDRLGSFSTTRALQSVEIHIRSESWFETFRLLFQICSELIARELTYQITRKLPSELCGQLALEVARDTYANLDTHSRRVLLEALSKEVRPSTEGDQNADRAIIDWKHTIASFLNRPPNEMSVEEFLSNQNRVSLPSLIILSETSISDTGLRNLAGLPIKTLDLSDTHISDRGLSNLEGIQIEVLDLANTRITDNGLTYLRSLPLKWLSLAGTSITDEGLSELRSLQIEKLNLEGTRVSDRGLNHLYHLPLTWWSLSNTNVTNNGKKRLEAAIHANSRYRQSRDYQ